ncbi:U3 snoRNA associated-domain-containing protein [Lophiotrema nucula]|uniref:U3 snoRNA associated-domain-containing protein n=1 Tax=Lophiotrema nucula TaxID=690887 RepID=A0A6A5YJR6_9PLEO|nr:U3 snoRNA associated-domain-containing protein [Lophiotrema nucula]
MLANVLHAARRILSHSPSAQSPRFQDEDNTRTDHDANMVSTRSGAVAEGTPRSEARSTPRTRGGKRTLEVQGTPTTAKRRRKSERENSESPEEEVRTKLDNIVVTPRSPTKRPKKLPVRERATRSSPRTKASPPAEPEVDTGGEEEENAPVSSPNQPFFTPGPQRQGSVYETPATSKPAKDGSSAPRDSKTVVQVVIGSSNAGTKKNTRRSKATEVDERHGTPEDERISTSLREEIPSSTFDSDEAGLSTQESAVDNTQTTPVVPKKRHVRFGSEGPAEPAPVVINEQGHKRFEPEVSGQIDGDKDADSESDDDEAPETVTAASATSKAQAAEASAAQALGAQRERERQKQENRAALIAEEKDAKRKKQEKEARRVAQREAARKQKFGVVEPALDLDTSNMPELLPESLLEAIGDQRPPTPPPMLPGRTAEEKRKEKLNRHIKFLERGQKAIKDVKKGPVNVSVLAEQNKFLAPKVNRDTKNVREKWLKGRQNEMKPQKGRKPIGFKKMERRPVTSGFVKDDDW